MTQVFHALPPATATVEAPDQKGVENSVMIASALGRHVHDCWTRAKMAKQPITERLLACERQRRGEYDPDRMADIEEAGGSDIFMMITDVKCNAAKSWIQDVMLQNDRPFDLEPANEPEIPPEIRLSIIDLVRFEAEQYVMAGQQMHPEAFRRRLMEVNDMVKLRVREEAKATAERHARVIEDQMDQGGFHRAMQDFIDDFVTFPTAILKGPTVRRKKRMAWGPNYLPVVVEDFARDVERVPAYDIFPSANSRGVDDGYLIQRHRLDTKTLESLKGVPGYSDSEIEQVIARYGMQGYRYNEYGDQQRDNLQGKPHSMIYNDHIIEALEFWGPVRGDMLIDWGMRSNIEPHRVYEVNVWVIAGFVIKAVINPDPLGRRPYEIASWRSIPGAFWGMALPEIMRDVQVMCNAAARSLANNMALASGPQVDVSVDRLPQGEEITNIHPFKIWQTTSDKTGGNQQAIKFFQPDMKAAELMGIYNQFAKQADEVTGIPNYIYGSGSGASGAGRTASGLSMLMDNAAKGIKAAVLVVDRVVTMVVERFYVHNMIYNPDPYIKGDFKVVTRGAMGLVAKEQIQVRRNEFLNLTLSNPVALQIVGPEGASYLMRETAKGLQMDTDKLVPTVEMVKFKQEQIQNAMQTLQAPAGGAQPGQTAAPQTIDAAGDAVGQEPMNTVQPQQGVS